MRELLLVLRRRRVGSEEELAAAAGNAVDSAEKKLARMLSERGAAPPRLFFGRMGSGERVEIPIADLTGVSLWSTGSTGSGKSAHGLATELALVAPESPAVFWKIDAKGEAAPWLTDLFLPVIVGAWSERAREHFFETYRVVNPFDASNLPGMNVLAPQGVPRALHAKEVAVLVAESLGGVTGMGHRMTTILTFAVRLALSVPGLSLLEVRALLTNPGYLNGLLRFSDDVEAKEYFLFRFPKESKEALLAVIARLDLLLLVEDTARVLAAPDAIDIGTWIERGVTICNFGDVPRGAEYLGNFWLGLMFRALVRAVMGRPVTPETRPLFASVDEWQVALDEELARHFERVLTLSRFKRASWWFTNQLAGQIGSRFPQLLATLKNSCGIQIAFRQSHEDALALTHMLPEGGERTRSRDAGAAAFARLPDRTFWFYWKKRGLEAVKLISPTVNFDGARRALDRVPADIREACQGRSGGYSRHALDRVLAARRARVAAVADGTATHPCPEWRASVPAISLSSTLSPTNSDERSEPVTDVAASAPETSDVASSPAMPALGEDDGFPSLG